MAYRCYCSPKRLASLRAEQARLKQPIGYDRRCRELGDGNQNGDLHVVRFAMPLDGETNVSDLNEATSPSTTRLSTTSC